MPLPTASKAPSSRERVRVFVEDPELASGLDAEGLATAEQITAPVLRVPTGSWDFQADPSKLSSHLGLLVVEGLLLREVIVGEVACAELLGTGDVLRPWTASSGEQASIQAEARWEALQDVRLAVLDPRLLTKGYGRRFLASLPPAPIVQNLTAVEAFFSIV